MADYDIIIKGGAIVDGTRTPRYVSDLAVKHGKVAKIGGLRGASADKVLDASGLIVAPGFVDLHTHYDAQIRGTPTARCPAGMGSPRCSSVTAGSALHRAGRRTGSGPRS